MQGKKRSSVWKWLVGIIVLVVIVVTGGLLWSKQAKTDSTKQDTVATKTAKKSSNNSKQSSSSIKKSKTKLSVDALGPKASAATIAYYGSRHFGSDWQTAFNDANSSNGLTASLSTDNVDKMAKPGSGVAYYLQSSADSKNSADYSKAPSYTLASDKTIYFYNAGQYDKVAGTSSLSTVVDYANQHAQGDHITALTDRITVTDQRGSSNSSDTEGNGNQITEAYLRNHENSVYQMAIYFGMMNSNEPAWKTLKREVLDNKRSLKIGDQYDDSYFSYIDYSDGGTSGCLIYLEAGSKITGRLDTVTLSDDSVDDTDDLWEHDSINTHDEVPGITLKTLIKYTNAHGGTKVLDKIDWQDSLDD